MSKRGFGMGININIIFIILFSLSLIGIIINQSNTIIILILIEIMFLSIILLFLYSSFYSNQLTGQIISLYIIALAAVESALGLSIMIIFYKLRGSISIKLLNLIKG